MSLRSYHRSKAPAALRLLVVVVTTVVWFPIVAGLKAKRYAHSGHEFIASGAPPHLSEFLYELGEAGIPAQIPLFPEGNVPEEFPGEMSRLFESESLGAEKLINYPDKEASFRSLSKQCGITFRPGARSAEWYFNVRKPTLQPLLLSQSNPKRTDAAVIIAPGGGQAYLEWTNEGYDFAEVLLSLGINAFILKYRVPTRGTEVYLSDAQRAVSYVRKNAKHFGLNASRIGFGGFSAGGMLTTDLSTSAKRHYSRIDDTDDVSYLPDFALVIYGGGPGFIGKGQHPPPTFAVHAVNDPCVPVMSSLQYCKALREYGQTCDGHYYESGGHAYSVCLTDKVSAPGYQFASWDWASDEICEWPLLLERFLRKQVVGEQLAANASTVMLDFINRSRRARLLKREDIGQYERTLDVTTLPQNYSSIINSITSTGKV